MLLDQVGFQEQRFGLASDDNRVDVRGVTRQLTDLVRAVRIPSEVASHARAERLGLPDVEHRALGILEQVDAGPRRKIRDQLGVQLDRWPER